MRDNERIERNRQALVDAGLDAFVSSLPINVLLLTGYWPVIGASVAVFTRGGETFLLVPEDEAALAETGWADRTETFTTGSLQELRSFRDWAREPLKRLLADIGLKGRIAIEDEMVSEPASYAAMSLTRPVIAELIGEVDGVSLVSADGEFERLRAVLTTNEIEFVRLACSAAEAGFHHGCRQIAVDKAETEIAAAFREPLSVSISGHPLKRADGYTFCMSGENSYAASAAYQRSTDRRLKNGDLVLVHCNSYVNGYWTDITRTYSLCSLKEKRAALFDCILTATQAAMDAIRPGVSARSVDAAARNVLRDCGISDEFKHGLGHGVGFHAIDHMAMPRLHPASDDLLQAGMVFNIEPAAYIEGLGGIRQCNMVLVTPDGAEMLTPFHNQLHELLVGD